MPHCHTFLDHLRSRGYRITPQREMVIQTIAHSQAHMTAEEVAAVVHERARAVNVATVYRTLDMLVREGLASRLVLGNGNTIYATSHHGPHLHLYCRQCGTVIEVAQHHLEPTITHLQQTIQSQYGFTPDLAHFAIPGLCDTCRLTLTDEEGEETTL
jgi:Fur family ferric uptake transcriptional regulator